MLRKLIAFLYRSVFPKKYWRNYWLSCECGRGRCNALKQWLRDNPNASPEDMPDVQQSKAFYDSM
jgi:hypothetical protein